MKDFTHKLVLSAAVIGLLALNFTAYLYYYYSSPGPLAERTTVLFKKGTGFRDIVDQLAEKEVIRHPLFFKGIAVLLGDARKFNAGEYNFSAAISPRLVMDMIAEGHVVVHRVTVSEGLTVPQVIALLDSEQLLEGHVVENIREGSLLPQTYHYTYGDSRQELIARMQAGMESTLKELWEKRKPGLPIGTPEEALTLASIVEKETGVADERGRVASVFINRLRKGMRLQSDPTVRYAIEKDKGPMGRSLVMSDLKYNSPYNTYVYTGLPPAPIANPGRSALEATLNPLETNDFYFVATGTGGHNFSETLDSHNKNVVEYRKEVKKQKAEKNPPPPAPLPAKPKAKR
jgi:UPF0755 protein